MASRPLRISVFALGLLFCTSAAAEDNKVETSNAIYEIRPDPKNEDRKCVFKGTTQLLCIERDLVTFGNPVKTKDYTLIPIYDDCGGSACGRSETTLLIEKGRQTKIDRTLKRFCVECQNKFEAKADLKVAIALGRPCILVAVPQRRPHRVEEAARSERAALGRRLQLSL